MQSYQEYDMVGLEFFYKGAYDSAMSVYEQLEDKKGNYVCNDIIMWTSST